MSRALCVLVIALFVGLTQPWEIVISVGDRLEFYTIMGIKRATVHYLTSHIMTALAYDEVQNNLLFVDKQDDNDAVCGYNMSTLRFKCYVKRNGRNIHGLTFDPISEIMFFTDTNEKSIYWFSFKPESKNNDTGNLLIKIDDGTPRDIAVDGCRGYIYWINRNVKSASIERARFNGSEREVVIKVEWDTWDMHSLVIDQQKQKLYWSMPDNSSKTYTYSADLDGKNIVSLIAQPGLWWTYSHPNSYTVRKNSLYVVEQAIYISDNPRTRVKKFLPATSTRYYYKMLEIDAVGVVGIAANYKMKDQFQGISDCNDIFNNRYATDDSFKNGTEYESPYCVHGTKVNGQSFCKCTPGYTGERCEVSVCENYCLQGNCSFSEQGLPKCRCDAGYSGERCEVNACLGYCSNNGSCSLNDSGPICHCQGDYLGHRCEISGCINYCLHGNCGLNEEGVPECRCSSGYSGERCEINACYQYCSNNGTCSLTEEAVPVCECVGEYEGERCQVPVALNHGDGFQHEEVTACQCVGSHGGSNNG